MSKYLVSLTSGDTVEVTASSYNYDEAFHVFLQDDETKLVVPARQVSYVGRKEDKPSETYCSQGLCPNGPGCKWDAKQVLEIRVSASPGDVSADVLKTLGFELGKHGVRRGGA